MRIGILTFHAAHNYGAVLQCYALQEYLKSLGHEVWVIDYRNKQLLAVYECFRVKRFIRKNPIEFCKRFIHEVSEYSIRKKRKKVFEKFTNTYFSTIPVESIKTRNIDWILIGSDQVWNFQLTKGFDIYYWGKFERPESTKIASYAASMQDSWTNEEGKIIKELLLNFNKISVREKSIAEKLKLLTPSQQVNQVVDPTLLLTSSQWDAFAIKPKIADNYILLYQVEPSRIATEVATFVSMKLGISIIQLSANLNLANDKEMISLSPEEFVGLFKYSSFVVCSSFHGTVFSIQFKRPFYSVKGEGKNARVESLLNSLGLVDRFIDSLPLDVAPVDYQRVELNLIRDKSVTYLNELSVKE